MASVRNRHDPSFTDREDWVDMYHARITGFGTGSVQIAETRLTRQSFRADNCPGGATKDAGFLGDYHNLAVSADGRTIWTAYIARVPYGQGGFSIRNCYVRKIRINCGLSADFNGDETVSEADATVYLNAFAQGDLATDLDLDWTVTAGDLTTFLARYADETGG